MARERIVEAFILKRQDYGEADQIITLFSKEEGKLRALVKAAKLPTSKLQPVLQPLFETRVTLTGSAGGHGLSKVIGAQIIKAYSGILESESKLGVWYMASELIIRALPDSAPNNHLYSELQKYAAFLHHTELTSDQAKHSATQFQIKVLSTLGLGIRTVKNPPASLWFSIDRGGFMPDDSTDSQQISLQDYQVFQNMESGDYIANFGAAPETLDKLDKIVTRFVTYQLEREIKSQRFLR